MEDKELKELGFTEEDIESASKVDTNRIGSCNFKQETIRERACNGLLWLVEQDRITIDKAYITSIAYDGWLQIDALQDELLDTGEIKGMHNINDVFIIPHNLYRV